MNNRLLDEIQAAYSAHELWPTRCTSFGCFACPLTALAIGRGVVNKDDPNLELDDEKNPVFPWACNEFGEVWVRGFVDGFDEDDKTCDDPEYLAGYALGELALEQLFPRDGLFSF